ncbi:MAG: UDP-3-O-acyl-N-acetylglucosamine deacetylase [Rhizobiaceae bacterium]|nr:UDP-3-O-acyl-N-acetylglucosamine deacetylase [Rhizobiaceae bacterium]
MGNELFDCQSTLKAPVSISGVGVHNGKPVSVHFSPADPDTGVVFHGTNGSSEEQEIRASVATIGSTDHCTVLGDPRGFHVSTVEHLMATLFALGIDNVHVEVDSSEMPILDGSAAQFVDAFEQTGIEVQAVRRRYIRVRKPVRIEHGASWAEFRPHDGTRFEIEIDFDSPAIGRQTFESDIDAAVFRRDIARARTFGFLKDVESLWAAGYALGSSLENSVVIGDDHKVINMEGLRYKDEFVRHKTLDAMGDLALAGARFIGLFRSYRGGHKLNAAALKQLLSDPTAFEIVETVRPERGRSAEMVQVSAPVYAPWAI